MRSRAMLLVASAVPLAAAAAGPWLYDMGPERSSLEPDFTRVTSTTVATGGAAFGWASSEGLRAQSRAYTQTVFNASRGVDEPPPIWTTPLMEDAILGSRPNEFRLPALPSGGWVAVVCGLSDAARSQYFDFTVALGRDERRVCFEGGHRFRVVRFEVPPDAGPLSVRLVPRSLWCVNAILAGSASDAERINEGPLRRVFGALGAWAPPEEWARWRRDPDPDPGPMPTPTPEEAARGFLVFARPWAACVFPHDSPRPDDWPPRLRMFATPGEREPFTFTIRPLRAMAQVRVRVRGLGPVDARDIEIRKVRYMAARPSHRVLHRWRVVPDLLERFDTADLPPNENARFWVTVRVPDDAPAGIWTGAVDVAWADGAIEIPVTLRVLPFRLLDDPDRLFGIYYEHPYDRMAAATDEVSRAYFRARAEMEHADLAAHGTRNITLSCYPPPADADGRFRFQWDWLQQKFDLWRRHGFRGPAVMQINAAGVYAKHTGERYGSHLRGVRDPPASFAAEITAMVREIEAERRRRGWPEFLYYPVDEPSAEPASVRFMSVVLQACKDAGVRTYVTADRAHAAFEPLAALVDVWCMQPFSIDRESVRREAERGVEMWCYPNHIAGENDRTPVAGARMTYGFGFWRSGYRALIPWIYSSPRGDPWNYLDGPVHDFLNGHEDDGRPVPAALWEAMREGWDDYRYLYTLERTLNAARRSQRPGVPAAVAAAERELAEVEAAIRVQPKYRYDGLWAPAEFDVHRWRIARQILALHDAMAE